MEKIEDQLHIISSLLMKAYDISNEEYEDIVVATYAAKIKIANGEGKESDRISKKIEDVLKRLDS